MANLGFVGLGTMGGGMAKRLLSAGHQVTGYNRTKSRAQWLVDLGMGWGDTPRAVAEAADVTFTLVADTEALRRNLELLKTEHRDLDDVILRVSESASINQLQVKRLKKRKLVLKDQIAKLESQLLPDIIA